MIADLISEFSFVAYCLMLAVVFFAGVEPNMWVSGIWLVTAFAWAVLTIIPVKE